MAWCHHDIRCVTTTMTLFLVLSSHRVITTSCHHDTLSGLCVCCGGPHLPARARVGGQDDGGFHEAVFREEESASGLGLPKAHLQQVLQLLAQLVCPRRQPATRSGCHPSDGIATLFDSPQHAPAVTPLTG